MLNSLLREYGVDKSIVLIFNNLIKSLSEILGNF